MIYSSYFKKINNEIITFDLKVFPKDDSMIVKALFSINKNQMKGKNYEY